MDTEPLEEGVRALQRTFAWAPDWVISLIVFAIALLVAFVVHRFAFRVATHLAAGRDLFWRSLVQRTERPALFGVVLVLFGIAAGLAPLNATEQLVVARLLQISLIALAAWFALTALRIWVTVYLRKFKLDAEDNLLARKHVTQTRILRRVANAIIITVALSAALMTFDSVKQYGVSLLASAGAAGLVVGLALQPVLKNLIAGIQLAVTQPIRIDDALLVEGEWGNVEEITSTYVVVRIWDWRRLVLPLSYFIEHPFQNWTREGAALIGNVMIYLDYSVPVAALRAKVEEIVAASPLWDRRVVNVQVTDFREHVAEVRILMSAGNAGRTFDLRCEVREKLMAWLQESHPQALPRFRADLTPPPLRPAPAEQQPRPELVRA